MRYAISAKQGAVAMSAAVHGGAGPMKTREPATIPDEHELVADETTIDLGDSSGTESGRPYGRLSESLDRARRSAEFGRDLAWRIKQRIQMRTSERIRELEVVAVGDTVEIRGRCATFYTKQLAQQAAMGVLENETLINCIEVGIGR